MHYEMREQREQDLIAETLENTGFPGRNQGFDSPTRCDCLNTAQPGDAGNTEGWYLQRFLSYGKVQLFPFAFVRIFLSYY
jgi:hypothetical protein